MNPAILKDHRYRFSAVVLGWGIVWAGGCHASARQGIAPNLRQSSTPESVAELSLRCAELESSAGEDPLGFLKMCQEHYESTVFDYRCRFTKRERILGRVSNEQEMAVRFREHPYSVDMRWVRNVGPARRVNYVAGRWVHRGRQMALIEPSGLLGLLLPGGVRRDIHAKDVRNAARRTIDQFGFKNTLDLIIKYCEMADSDPDYELSYVRRGVVNGRPTLVFERHLPFTVENEPYPDRVQVIEIDCAWLVPLRCVAFADEERQELLGSYTTSAVEFNVGLTDADF